MLLAQIRKYFEVDAPDVDLVHETCPVARPRAGPSLHLSFNCRRILVRDACEARHAIREQRRDLQPEARLAARARGPDLTGQRGVG
jgi:hypothetical protein